MHYEMMLFTLLVVVPDSEDVELDITVCSFDRTSGIHDTCGNIFEIVLSYNMRYDVSEMATV